MGFCATRLALVAVAVAFVLVVDRSRGYTTPPNNPFPSSAANKKDTNKKASPWKFGHADRAGLGKGHSVHHGKKVKKAEDHYCANTTANAEIKTAQVEIERLTDEI